MMFGHQEIDDFLTLVNKCRMYENDMKADEAMTLRVDPPRNFGPQRNHPQGKGKDRMFGDDRQPYAAPTGHRDRNFQVSRPPTVPTGEELGHIKRFCPKLDRRLNVIHAERARDHGRVVTMSGAGASDVDGPVKGKYMVAGIPLLVLLDSGATHSLYLLN
ncbi:hypothetical protein Lal_00035418, partial [Lupinus albus]